jgi:uncharacterized protein YbjQ (UPF0145 family)
MEAFIELWQILLVVFLLILAFFTGSFAEWRHYKSIIRREDALGDLVVVVAKTLPPLHPAPATTLVRGNVVISVDYFKRFLARLRMIFGGRIHTYESLLDRARREAILRMQKQARELGATMIFNMRFETSSISKGRKNAVGTVEVLAYGTAIIPQS